MPLRSPSGLLPAPQSDHLTPIEAPVASYEGVRDGGRWIKECVAVADGARGLRSRSGSADATDVAKRGRGRLMAFDLASNATL
jgi:hypothetical protein